ncbi:hypothetical protein AMAG_04558 [Allomyces macrogynus ATCC 38327]|uniref:Uncharacterized protein n=1 Tax=Allomyces macrogynus (strain ATCC 38327) TaxID=578462 RepID=A0A0L0S5Q7_ALLM3|nr:hypothetical protein AMAG_04558 [Allomyces macrogynus ATCC 38327]|eukprot:KNE57699.1 hypothetical protein AMAG_04558 [Allomyces macrogynus ATCC 38327]
MSGNIKDKSSTSSLAGTGYPRTHADTLRTDAPATATASTTTTTGGATGHESVLGHAVHALSDTAASMISAVTDRIGLTHATAPAPASVTTVETASPFKKDLPADSCIIEPSLSSSFEKPVEGKTAATTTTTTTTTVTPASDIPVASQIAQQATLPKSGAAGYVPPPTDESALAAEGLLPSLSGIVHSVTDTASAAVHMVTDPFVHGVHAVTDTASAAVHMVTDPLARSAHAATDTAALYWGAGVKSTQETLADVREKTAETWDKAKHASINAAEVTAQQTRDLAAAVGGTAKDAAVTADKTAGKAVDVASDKAVEAKESAQDAAGRAVQYGAETMQEAKDAAWQTKEWVAGKAGAAAETVKDSARRADVMTAQAVDAAADKMAQLKVAAESEWEQTKDTAGKEWDATKHTTAQMAKKADKAAGAAVDTAAEKWGAAKSTAAQLGKKADRAAGAAVDTAAEKWEKTKDVAADKWDTTKQSAGAAVDMAAGKLEQAKDTAAETWDATKQKTGEMAKKADRAAGAAVDTAEGKWQQTKVAASETLDQAKESARRHGGEEAERDAALSEAQAYEQQQRAAAKLRQEPAKTTVTVVTASGEPTQHSVRVGALPTTRVVKPLEGELIGTVGGGTATGKPAPAKDPLKPAIAQGDAPSYAAMARSGGGLEE